MGKPSIPRRRVHFVEYRWQSPCTSANKIYDMIVINHLFDSLISNVQGRNNRLLPKLMNWFKNMDSCHFYSSKKKKLDTFFKNFSELLFHRIFIKSCMLIENYFVLIIGYFFIFYQKSIKLTSILFFQNIFLPRNFVLFYIFKKINLFDRFKLYDRGHDSQDICLFGLKQIKFEEMMITNWWLLLAHVWFYCFSLTPIHHLFFRSVLSPFYHSSNQTPFSVTHALEGPIVFILQ